MKSDELRKKFIDYFEGKDHKVIPSASLVPKEHDITESDMTLFTTAGMQQFKRFYVNPSEAPFSRATSSQKCIRTGDIDEVGDDTHLSFFEMLGNFSFGYPGKEGSYFKEEAIKYAWEFLTKELKFDTKRLHATYFDQSKAKLNIDVNTDTDSKKILEQIPGLEKIVPQGDDNYWSLGTIGSPGGPTVEFYVDGIEVWNLVFNEWTKIEGGWKSSEQKGVDTGMGLERLLTTLNKNDNVYETDLFIPIIKKLEEISEVEYSDELDVIDVNDFDATILMRIIVDHIKAATFAIGDGVLPSNKGAGYVVRRTIRRAIVKAHQLGIKENFTTELADVVFDIYNGVYYSSSDSEKSVDSSRQVSNNKQDDVKIELEKEEIKFRKTLKEGLNNITTLAVLHKVVEGDVKDKEMVKLLEEISEFVFKEYQSGGFPIELSLEEFKRLGIDRERIERVQDMTQKLVEQHQELSRTASAGMFKGGLGDAGEIAVKYHTATHLLHQALRQVLGEHVQQKGSNITAERLRFDFVHTDKMTPEQICEVENIVNEQIEKDLPVTMEEMSVDEAKKSGALGFFEHKYGDKVKVYTIGPSTSSGSREFFSREICGGPHVTHTGELGHFYINKEESSSAGIRRIKAVLE